MRKDGFTMIEGLVVVLLAAFLLAIFVPAFTGSTDGHIHKRTLSRGTSIYKSTFSAYTDEVANPECELPHAFASSTSNDGKGWGSSSAYFTYLCQEDVLSMDWRFFHAGKLPAQPGRYDGTGKNDVLRAECNAWVVVEDAGPEETGALFMYTRNVQGRKLSYSPDEEFKPYGKPFGKKAVLGIFMGGGSVLLREKKEYRWEFLNPNGNTNKVLRP